MSKLFRPAKLRLSCLLSWCSGQNLGIGRPRGPTGAQAGNHRNSTILLYKTYGFSRGGQNLENRRPRGPTGAQAGNHQNSTIFLNKTYGFSRGKQNSGIQGPKGPTGAHAGILTIKLKKS